MFRAFCSASLDSQLLSGCRAVAAHQTLYTVRYCRDLEYGCSMRYSMSQLAPLSLLVAPEAAQPFNSKAPSDLMRIIPVSHFKSEALES